MDAFFAAILAAFSLALMGLGCWAMAVAYPHVAWSLEGGAAGLSFGLAMVGTMIAAGAALVNVGLVLNELA